MDKIRPLAISAFVFCKSLLLLIGLAEGETKAAKVPPAQGKFEAPGLLKAVQLCENEAVHSFALTRGEERNKRENHAEDNP